MPVTEHDRAHARMLVQTIAEGGASVSPAAGVEFIADCFAKAREQGKAEQQKRGDALAADLAHVIANREHVLAAVLKLRDKAPALLHEWRKSRGRRVELADTLAELVENALAKLLVRATGDGWIVDGFVALCPKCRRVKEGTVSWGLSHAKVCDWRPIVRTVLEERDELAKEVKRLQAVIEKNARLNEIGAERLAKQVDRAKAAEARIQSAADELAREMPERAARDDASANSWHCARIDAALKRLAGSL